MTCLAAWTLAVMVEGASARALPEALADGFADSVRAAPRTETRFPIWLPELVGNARALRITGAFGEAEVLGPRLEPAGLFSSSDSIVVSRSASVPFVPWDEIAEIRRPVSAAGMGARAGALAGALAAIVIGVQSEIDSGGPWGGLEAIGALGTAIGVTLVGAGAGALVGSPFTRWEQIYPEVSPEQRGWGSRPIMKERSEYPQGDRFMNP